MINCYQNIFEICSQVNKIILKIYLNIFVYFNEFFCYHLIVEESGVCLKKRSYLFVLVMILPYAWVSAQQFRNITVPRAKYLYEYREIYLAKMRDSLNSDLYKIHADKNMMEDLVKSVYNRTLRYNVYKYRLYDRLDTLSLLEFTIKDLESSSYFKSKVPEWNDSSLVEYITFRIELNLIKKYFSEFNLEEFRQTDVYKKLLGKITEDSLSSVEFDIILEKIQKVGFDPLHFYYKPKSRQEQLKADEFDINKFNFNEMIEFYEEYTTYLDSAESKYKVNKEIIVAILRKETNLGRVELKYNPFEVLLGQALYSITNPATQIAERTNNLKRISRLQESAASSLYHMIKYCMKNSLDPQDMKSNLVGALGHPQFMPFNLHLAIDGNNDGITDLSSIEDSIFSIGNFLLYNGWNEYIELNPDNKERIVKQILKYNSNDSYADSVFEIAYELKKRNSK
jgi:hypothetical protein